MLLCDFISERLLYQTIGIFLDTRPCSRGFHGCACFVLEALRWIGGFPVLTRTGNVDSVCKVTLEDGVVSGHLCICASFSVLLYLSFLFTGVSFVRVGWHREKTPTRAEERASSAFLMGLRNVISRVDSERARLSEREEQTPLTWYHHKGDEEGRLPETTASCHWQPSTGRAFSVRALARNSGFSQSSWDRNFEKAACLTVCFLLFLCFQKWLKFTFWYSRDLASSCLPPMWSI